MTTLVIGDVHGCLRSLENLLRAAQWSSRHDDLVFVGDTINRGPHSLDTLRFVRSLGSRARALIGNHEMYLLACAVGVANPKPDDTLSQILGAPDADELIRWVRGWPLAIDRGADTIVHAGFSPLWSHDQAMQIAADASALMRGRSWARLVRRCLHDRPEGWSGSSDRMVAAVEAINILTRIRMVDQTGRPNHRFKGAPQEARDGELAWYAHPGFSWPGRRVIFGHWAAHGFGVRPEVVALDSGCIWGRELTALNLTTGVVTQVPAVEAPAAD